MNATNATMNAAMDDTYEQRLAATVADLQARAEALEGRLATEPNNAAIRDQLRDTGYWLPIARAHLAAAEEQCTTGKVRWERPAAVTFPSLKGRRYGI
jgi:hypothetical protein